jgi:hypothetical protein
VQQIFRSKINDVSDLTKFAFTEIANRVCFAPSCSLHEGRFAIVKKRWKRDAVDALAPGAAGGSQGGETRE